MGNKSIVKENVKFKTHKVNFNLTDCNNSLAIPLYVEKWIIRLICSYHWDTIYSYKLWIRIKSSFYDLSFLFQSSFWGMYYLQWWNMPIPLRQRRISKYFGLVLVNFVVVSEACYKNYSNILLREWYCFWHSSFEPFYTYLKSCKI